MKAIGTIPEDISAPIAHGRLSSPHLLDTTNTHLAWCYTKDMPHTSAIQSTTTNPSPLCRIWTNTGGGMRIIVRMVQETAVAIGGTRRFYLYFNNQRIYEYSLDRFVMYTFTFDFTGLPPNGVLEFWHGTLRQWPDFVLRIEQIYAMRGRGVIHCEYLSTITSGWPSTTEARSRTAVFNLEHPPMATRKTIKNAASAGRSYIGD